MYISLHLVGDLETNAYIISENKKDCFIIDPGDNAKEIIDDINKEGFSPQGILLTHGHLDHIMGIPEIIAYFDAKGVHVPVYIHRDDASSLGAEAVSYHKGFFMSVNPAMFYQNIHHIEKLPQAEQFLEDESMITDSSLQVLHTPGHSPGSVCFYSKKHNTLFSGDTLFKDSVGRCDLPGGNMNTLKQSIQEKLLGLGGDTNILPGHGEATSLAEELKNNPFL